MAKRGKKSKNFVPILIVIILGVIYGIISSNMNSTYSMEDDDVISTSKVVENLSDLSVYFLDVGQADSILICNNDEYMLIDAGNNEDGPLLVDYFKEMGIVKFSYVVATHPHEDHIGGLDDIINNFEIEKLYMPDAITTTKTFENILEAMEDNNLSYEVPKIDEEFNFADTKIKVLYTGTDTSDLNNTSIVLKMSYGNNSFLFTGDATSKTEKLLLDKDIESDVLKVGHHGSKYSTTLEFLDKVKPRYAIISVGENNSYDHPSNGTLEKLEKRSIKVYRTDELGTILVTSDGNDINITNFSTNTNGG